MVTAMKRAFLAGLLATLAAALLWSQQVPPVTPPTFPPQPPNQPADSDDPAEAAQHGVARLSLMRGNVSVRQGESGELSAGVMNAPLLKEDAVLTGDQSYAEVQFDAVNMVRIAQNSEVRFGEVQYHNYALQVAAGTATYRMLRDGDFLVELSLPQVSVRPLHAGTYRVSVLPDGTTEIRVLSGDAEVYSAHGSEKLAAAQMMLVRGTENDPEYQILSSPMPDEWDRWNDRRDAELNRSVSQRYVSPDIYGTEELDANGNWQYDPAYGNVWVPNVDADWAPYREGRWDYEPYYGWTWISYDPFGWAPYHYGRWYHGGRGWCWYPGAIGARYYWHPGLVAFFGWGGGGFGSGVSLFGSFGYSHVGWVPLAPHEAFHPWYGSGRSGYIASNVNIINTYRNARIESGVTSMRSGDFGRIPVSRTNFVRASSGDLARGGAIRGQMPFSPSRESYRFSDATVNRQGLPRTNPAQTFVSRGNLARQGGSVTNLNQNQGWRRMEGSSSGPGFARGPQPGAGNRGWQRLDTGTPNGVSRPQYSAPQAPSRPNFGGGGPGYRPAPSYSAPQAPRQLAPQQPVRISPPIVRERGASGGGGPDVHSGFGGAHSNPGGGGSRPSGGGGGRPSGGGGGRPSGGGGGHSGGGGGHSGGGHR